MTAASFAALALAEYPDRPVSFVVPFPSGDLEDVLTRLIAEEFEAKYGVAGAVAKKPSEGGPFSGAAKVAALPACLGIFLQNIGIEPNVDDPGVRMIDFDHGGFG